MLSTITHQSSVSLVPDYFTRLGLTKTKPNQRVNMNKLSIVLQSGKGKVKLNKGSKFLIAYPVY